jgi:pyruvate carboxylase
VLQHGDTSALPTPVFFYGPQLQQELAVEIDPGKTLLVALQSVAADGETAHKVQFELNGQSRTVRVVRPTRRR